MKIFCTIVTTLFLIGKTTSEEVFPNGKPMAGDMGDVDTFLEKMYDPNLYECAFDCDKDSDCMTGLLCADQHKLELSNAGLDSRKAYCGPAGAWNEEVCYDPTKIKGCDDYTDCCEEINFDEYIIQDVYNNFDLIPPYYQGLNWDNLYIQHKPENSNVFGYDSGYRHGTTSKYNHMFNGFGDAGTITALSKKRTFTMKSFMATPVFVNRLGFIFTGYDMHMNQVASYTVVLKNMKRPKLITLDSSFENIYMFKLESTLGGQWAAIDDMNICF